MQEIIGTIVVLVVLFAICFLAARSIYRDKKAGKPLCGGACGDSCHCCNKACSSAKK